MFNSMAEQTETTEYRSSYSTGPIATGVIVHDSNRDRAGWPQRLWQYLVHQLIRGHEPRIWQQYSTFGQLVWRIYDPRTGRSAYCETEAEVIDWIEETNNRW